MFGHTYLLWNRLWRFTSKNVIYTCICCVIEGSSWKYQLYTNNFNVPLMKRFNYMWVLKTKNFWKVFIPVTQKLHKNILIKKNWKKVLHIFWLRCIHKSIISVFVMSLEFPISYQMTPGKTFVVHRQRLCALLLLGPISRGSFVDLC